MPRQLPFLTCAVLLAAFTLTNCADSSSHEPPKPADCEGIEDQDSCTSQGCVFYENAVWYSVQDSCDSGQKRPACLAPERLDQPMNNTFLTVKPEGTTDPDVALYLSGQQNLQGWEACADEDGGACACSS